MTLLTVQIQNRLVSKHGARKPWSLVYGSEKKQFHNKRLKQQSFQNDQEVTVLYKEPKVLYPVRKRKKE